MQLKNKSLMSTDTIKPIFITGIYRSGTTLISRILDNHPDLNITYDSVHFMRFCVNKFNPINDELNYRKLVNEVKERVKSRLELNLDTEKIVNEVKNRKKIDYAQIYHIIMSNLLLKDSNTKIWGEKVNLCWRKIPEFLDMFPEGKTIIMVRDPRDVLISYKNMTIEPGLRYLDSIFASLDSLQYIKKFQEKFSSNNFCFIKYEDLVNLQEKTIQELCNFLEIKFDSIMLNGSQFKDKLGKTWKGDFTSLKTIEKISNKTIGRWKSKISKVELYLVEMVLREQMIDFGYDLAAAPLEKNEWDELFEILNDDFIKNRYLSWLETGHGHQKYPNQ